MEPMTKRIINACNLDAGAVDEYGTDEYQIDESNKNLQDLEGIYADYASLGRLSRLIFNPLS